MVLAMGLFGKKTAGDKEPRAHLTDPAMLRRKGTLGRARILELESKPSVGGSMADPAYHCTLTLEVLPEEGEPYRAKVQQRMVRSILGQLTGDDVVAPAWIDPKDPGKVAVDVAAGPIG
jgi:hypothetical protein